MKQITIIGCGLIGGSFAALIKKYHKSCQILGIGHRKESLEKGIEMNLIDEYSADLSSNKIQTSDLVILSTPISTILPIINQLNETISTSITIVDFSSVKSFLDNPIVKNSHHTIIPMHPMGGREVQGIEHASADVLEGCPLIIFESNVESKINQFFKSCSFNLVPCSSYKEHDEWMANISHGAYVISSLIPILLSEKNNDYLMKLNQISAGGFKDTTRVSDSAIEWGMDILDGNKLQLLDFLNNIEKIISELKNQLENNKLKEIKHTLEKAKNTRRIIINGNKH